MSFVMDAMSLATTQITEESAFLVVPKQSLNDPHRELVFFNPRMQLHRTLTSLAVGPALTRVKGSRLVDGLCSLGVRGIRYLKENRNVEHVTFVEANNHAIPLLKRNIRLNKLSKKNATVLFGDFNIVLNALKERVDLIELDPFGSPVFFLDTALRRLQRQSILSITATDLANLFGARPKPAVRHYDAKPLHVAYGHELAIRILLGRIARSAAIYDLAITPLLSFYEGHAVKCMVQLEKSVPAADEGLKHLGYVSHCASCLHRQTDRWPLKGCPACGNSMSYAGPLWTADTCDGVFLDQLLEENRVRHYSNQEKINHFLTTLKDEQGLAVGFFDLHRLAKRAGVSVPRMDRMLEVLRAQGFQAERSHCSPRGVKTNAPVAEVLSLLKAANQLSA